MTNPIEAAVAPLKSDAIVRAGQEAAKKIEYIRAELEKVGFDLDKCAPYPNGRFSRADYASARSKRNLFETVVKHRESRTWLGEPCLADIDPARVERFIETAKEDAALQYDAFVAKLVSKIGACVSAKLEGNHVWGYSTLLVTKADGSREFWKTQQIVNVSKLNKLFNQWPSRKLKIGGK